MKWIKVPCFAGCLVCAGLPALAQNLPDDVIVNEITVDGKDLPASRNGTLNLGARPADVIFHFGSPDNLNLPDKRVRYKMEGYDSDWHDGRCYMFLCARFYDETGDEIGQQDFKVEGDSAGWNGSFINSALTHRREVVTVPAHGSRLVIVISSGGPPATIGNYVVANLTVHEISSNAPLSPASGISAGCKCERENQFKFQ